MVTTEQYFPRGGKKPKVAFNEQKKFDFLRNSDRIGKKRKYKTPKNLPKEDDDLDRLSNVSYDSDEGIKSLSAEVISAKTLREGMVILGRVTNVFDTKVMISLPGRLTGSIIACHISPSYTKTLQAFVNEEIEDMKKLPELFAVGEYVNVSILKIITMEDKRTRLILSMMPQDVNKGITYNTIKEGSLLRASVDSVEDHGYVIDLGIQNCRTFLPKKYSDRNHVLDVGQVIWCIVKKCQKSSTNTIVTISNHLEAVKAVCVSGDKIQNYTVGDLKPGMAVDFYVNKPLRDGAEGCILSKSVGYVHVSQIDGKLHTGQTVKARLLYVMPITNLPFFTTREIFNSFKPNLEEEAPVKVGQIITYAKVSKVTENSIIFKFDNWIAIMSTRSIDQNIKGSQSINDMYPNGSEHSIRIIKYHPSDYAYICTDDQEILQQKYFQLSDLSIGEIVKATVDSVTDKGVVVYVGKWKGWIPETHVSDVALFQSTKPNQKISTSLAAKKFIPGHQISARVLKLDIPTSFLHLTAKPSLMDPKLYPLSEFEDAKVGFQYKGVIVKLFPFGVLVSFFGEAKALVEQKQLAHELITNIPAAFNLGQVVNCTVLSVDTEEKKIYASFIASGQIEINKNKKGKKSKKRVHPEANDIKAVEEEKQSKIGFENIDDHTESVETIDPIKEATELKNKKKKDKKKNIDDSNALDSPNQLEKGKKSKKRVLSDTDDNTTVVTKKNKVSEEDNDIITLSKIEEKKTKKKDKSDITNIENNKQTKSFEKIDPVIEETEIKIKKKKDKKKNIDDSNALDSPNQLEKGKKSKKTVHSETDNNTTVVTKKNKASEEDNDIITVSKREEKKMKKKDKSDIINIENNKQTMCFEKIDPVIEKTEIKMKNKKNKMMNIKESNSLVSVNPLQAVLKRLEPTESAESKIKKTKDKMKNVDKNKSLLIEGSKKATSEETDIKFPSLSNFWELNATSIAKNVAKREIQSSSESDAEMVIEPVKKKKKKLTVAEKVDKAREEEEKLRDIERQLAVNDAQPQSSDQFDRLLMANPNSSELWIAYMAFHLQATEIDRARSIGKKAIRTISFREEQDKLNVWLAMLNLENRFGTKESLTVTLQEALQTNEPFSVHSKMLDMYADTGKVQELSSLVDTIVTKYRNNPEAYVMAGESCYKMNLVDKARSVMQKAIGRLESKKHVPVLIKFAHMENNRGDTERAEALLEQIVGCFPQRVDVWGVYVDMLMKTYKVDNARLVLERAVSQKLPVRKMKILYKKWMDLEEKLGNPQLVERVRQMALEYIEKAKS